jgi:hypothetical protein
MEGPVPWTVVRATQFHEYLAAMLGVGARYGLLPVPPGLVQPVASAEVARLVAEVAVGGPRRGRVEIGGPEVSGPRSCCTTSSASGTTRSPAWWADARAASGVAGRVHAGER